MLPRLWALHSLYASLGYRQDRRLQILWSCSCSKEESLHLISIASVSIANPWITKEYDILLLSSEIPLLHEFVRNIIYGLLASELATITLLWICVIMNYCPTKICFEFLVYLKQGGDAKTKVYSDQTLMILNIWEGHKCSQVISVQNCPSC